MYVRRFKKQKVLVIAITNRLDKVHHKIRNSDLFTTVKFELPDWDTRIKIFKIKIRETWLGNFDRDLDFNRLAELTKGKSGCYIEGIVSRAQTLFLTRAYRLINLEGKITSLKEARVTTQDFIMAIKEEHQKSKSPMNFMYI